MKRRIAFALSSFFVSASLGWAQTAVLQIDDPGFGVSVDGGLDSDGDEIPDIIAGNPNFNGGLGRVKIYSGAGGAPLQSFPGPGFNDRFGSAVAFLPDVDGDEVSDFIVGAPQPPTSPPFGGGQVPTGPGYAQIYSGETGVVLFAFTGMEDNDLFGKSVAWIGDADTDSYADFAIGAPGVEGNAGAVFVYSGRFGTLLSLNPGLGAAELGSSLSGGFDIDGDGIPDYIAGLPRDLSVSGLLNGGAAFVYSGADHSVLFAVGATGLGDLFGSAVLCLPDLNGDGRGEFAVGAPFNDTAASNAGEVSVYSGANGALLYRVRGDSSDARFGASLGRAGDINRDGIPDFAVGATEKSPDIGFVSIRSGVNGNELCRFHGQAPGDGTGSSVGPSGNLDDEGGDEAVFGSPGASGKNIRIGNCKEPKRPNFHVAPGGAGTAQNLPNAQLPILLEGHEHFGGDLGTLDGAYMGSAVAIVPDLDRDGHADYLIGSPRQGTPDLGEVKLYSGKTAKPLSTLPTSPLAFFSGISVARAGDVDADGVEDLMYGSGSLVAGQNRVTIVSGAAWGEILGVIKAPDIGGGNGFTAEFAEKHSLAAAGDVNFDGFADILIGDPQYCYHGCWESDPQKFLRMGAIWIVSGEWIAKTHLGQTPQTAQTLYQIFGGQSFQSLGTSVAEMGDVNQDGFDDFAAGSAGDSPGESGQNDTGSVTVYSGGSGAVLWKVYGPNPAAFLGSSLCSTGDIDGDGAPDLLAGAPGASSLSIFESSAQLRSGRTGALLREFARPESDQLGVSVAGGFDLDGDASPDLAIGATPSNTPGFVLVVSGASLTKSSIVSGVAAGDLFGIALSIAGDLDGDGRADLLIGAPADSSAGLSEGSAKAFRLTPNPSTNGGLQTPASISF